MGRARTLWLSSMLVTAMIVQAFGFVGSAGANTQTSSFVQVGLKNTSYRVPIILSIPRSYREVLNPEISFPSFEGGFLIGTTEVTYGEWYAVRTWAESNGYTFANIGREGHDGVVGAAPTSASNEPVTQVSWLDIVVWSNAKSEQEKLTPVYVHNGHVLKDATSASVDNAVQRSANGYRLPTNNEWEMAARWLGTTAPTKGSLRRDRIATTVHGVTHYWTPSNYASGAVENVSNEIGNARVAWYRDNSSDGTQAVGEKASNALGMDDVSGNVWEWTYEKAIRGGCWSCDSAVLAVSWVTPLVARTHTGNSVGFRLSRTLN